MTGKTYLVAFVDRKGNTFHEVLSYGTTPSAAIRNPVVHWRLCTQSAAISKLPPAMDWRYWNAATPMGTILYR